MRGIDSRVFLDAAQKFNVWILVRQTNLDSLRYVGKPGFAPKPIECKAKTADRGDISGLVVDPSARRDAFSPLRLPAAEKSWKEFQVVLGSRAGWAVRDRAGDPYRGCVTYKGCLIHADYDLKDVIDADNFPRAMALHGELHGQHHKVSPEYLRVRNYINGRLGVPMIQHGASAQYEDHQEETVLVFGPGSVTATFHSARELRRWYELNGRVTLTGQPSPHRGDPNWRPRLVGDSQG